MKKMFTALWLAVFLLAVGGAAMAAKDNTAATLRLERTEGEAVALSSINGGDISILQGMKLYSGHQVTTGMASYAYLSLDDTKAAKMDANSKTEVKQSGKKLELNLAAGEIFFNVSAPLKSDETLNIRTSTMVTGVRGTSGVVKVIDEVTTEIYLLTGSVTVNYIDIAGVQRITTVTAGQKATVNVTRNDDGTETTEVTITELTEDEVAGFAAAEIAKDQALQQQITEQTKLSVPIIIGEAEARLAADQQADKEQQEQIEQDIIAATQDEETDPLFTEETAGGGGGGGGSSTPSRPVTRFNATQETIPFADIQTALASGDVVVTVDDPQQGGSVYTKGEDLQIPTGSTLTLGAGVSTTIDPERSMIIDGIVNNSGSIENNGTIVNNSANSFNHDNGGTIWGTGSIVNNGAMTISGPVSRYQEQSGYAYLPRLMASAAANNVGMTIRGEAAAGQEEYYEGPPPLITNSSSGTLTITEGAMILEQVTTAIVNYGTLNMTGGEVTSEAWGAWEIMGSTLYAIHNSGKFIYTAGTVKIADNDGGTGLLSNSIIYKADGTTQWPVVKTNNEMIEIENVNYIILEVGDE